MKRFGILTALSLSLAILTACGGGNGMTGSSPTTPPSPNTPPPVLGDSWTFSLQPASSSATLVASVDAVLSLADGKVTGYAHIDASGNPPSAQCFTLYQAIPLSGTVDAQGNISETSSSVNGQTFSFTGVLNADGSSISNGRYSFSGGCANGYVGQLAGQKIRGVSGTFAGTFTGGTDPISVTADLMQHAELNGTGFLKVTGTVAYESPTCSEEFSIDDSQLAGEFIQLHLTSTNSQITVYGRVESNSDQLHLADYDGDCGGGGVGFLIRQ